MKAIYMDHAATSPVHPQVIEAMVASLQNDFGNPSSIHQFGRKTRHALDEARSSIAKSIRAVPNEIVFTSGGTEADNLAIIGAAKANVEKGKHIITTAVEHHAALNACKSLEAEGFEVTYLQVNESGRISIEDLKGAIRQETTLITIMYGNNEVGTIQPITEIAQITKEHDILFHTDAVQAYGLIDLDVSKLGVDLLSVSAHKINGPKGVGFLYVKDGTKLVPSSQGGEQERKRRAGTENVAGIVGMETAVKLMYSDREEKVRLYHKMKETMTEIFKRESIQYYLNGDQNNVLPHVLNVSFPDAKVEPMLMNLDLAGIAVSSGSACTAGSHEPSHVLKAMYGDNERTQTAIRFSFGYGNTEEDATQAAEEVVKIVNRLKKL
ncbi:cysteine desulfurase family protein [Pseudalkalibacillus hwajinpoensis]|uniref:cysteine desulfurase n=1 Tax=Guptibacillus hwajinpoensis TaxID=208199 RepID=A0A4U1MIA7_9BACL|nr:cysteine desulfurase family protein [Pseudalkalibacillus hwajinpoensis]TKD70244.1 cysteine desulfurase [Pseudalkalibacillus hwajinpoensis]